MRLPIALPALVLALLGIVAPPAGASSIIYVKGPDLWLAAPDGSRKLQVTHAAAGGGYAWPSQADDGTIVAMDEATRVVRLDRRGRALGDPFPFSIRPGNPFGLLGPWSPTVSPNGRRISFGYDISHTSCQPVCTPTSGFGTGYSYADRFTELQTIGTFRGATEPSWADDDTTLAFAPGTATPIVFHTVGSPESKPWFADPEVPSADYGVLTRRKDKLAVGVGLGRPSSLVLYSVTSAPPNPREGDPPVSRCQVTSDDGTAIPRATWAPDGSALAFELHDAIYTMAVGDIAARGCAAIGPAVKLDDGLMPAWGPADLPTDAASAPAAPVAPAPVTTAPKPAPQPPSLTLAGRPTLATALRRGLTIRLVAARPKPVKVTATLKPAAARRLKVPATVARGTAPAGTGPVTIRVRFVAAAPKRLRRARSLDLTLRAAGATRTVHVER